MVSKIDGQTNPHHESPLRPIDKNEIRSNIEINEKDRPDEKAVDDDEIEVILDENVDVLPQRKSLVVQNPSFIVSLQSHLVLCLFSLPGNMTTMGSEGTDKNAKSAQSIDDFSIDFSVEKDREKSDISVCPNISTSNGHNDLNTMGNIQAEKPQLSYTNPSNSRTIPSMFSSRYKSFSDIQISRSVVRLPNPCKEDISVGNEKRKFERKKRTVRKKKEEDKTNKIHNPITKYFPKKEDGKSVTGKRKLSTLEDKISKKLKEG